VSEAPEAKREAAKRRLRASYIWGETVLADTVLRRGGAITIGPGATGRGHRVTFLTPDFDLPPRFKILERSRKRASVALVPGMSGELGVGGERIDVAEYLASPEPGSTPGATRTLELSPGDWGVLHLDGHGDHTIFFQFVEDDPRLGTARSRGNELLWPALVFTTLFIALLVAGTYPLRPTENPFLFPGNRQLIADYLIHRPEPQPIVRDQAAARTGDESGEAETPAPTVGEAGEASGAGEQPRAQQPRPHRPSRTEPERQLPEEIERGLLTERSRQAMRRAADADQVDRRLDDALDRLSQRAGSAGTGRGAGTGVGDRGIPGTGTTRGGRGSGGGGQAHADAVTRGQLDTGQTRQARGTAAGEGVSERQVQVRTGRASGDLGGLTADEIARVVRSRQNAIRACYERQLQRHPDLSGRIVIQWRIGPDGRVMGPRVRETTMRHGPVEDCIVRQVQAMQFPRSPGTANVNFPFLFNHR
jgi:hypothetical protein